MKHLLMSALLAGAFGAVSSTEAQAQLLNRIHQRMQTTVENKIVDKAGNAAGKGVDDAESGAKNSLKKKPKKEADTEEAEEQTETVADATSTEKADKAAAKPAKATPAAIKAYGAFDFIPGEKIMMEDDFRSYPDGEFPGRWRLKSGQAVVNAVEGRPAAVVTDGYPGYIEPRMKTTEGYLPADFTMEFDYYALKGAPDLVISFKSSDNGHQDIYLSQHSKTHYFANTYNSKWPGGEDFYDRWHRVSLIKKGSQIKTYIDQYRVMVIPDAEEALAWKRVELGGYVTSPDLPVVIANFKLAEGGGMNSMNKKFGEAKLVTHGINFDLDKATIKPESMGTINMVKKILLENQDLRFDIQGHTDNSGTATRNKELSQQRAEAIKAQLVSLGIDAARLTTKGLGDTKPMADNSTPEGMAMNRRVEFVRL